MKRTKQIAGLLIMLASVASLSQQVAAGEITSEQICRASIGIVMGQEPSIVKAYKTESDTIYLSYVRPADGSEWKYRCKIDGNKVAWAGETGRWRNGPDDESITFTVKSGGVEVVDTYSDGSAMTEFYSAEQLK